MDYNGFRCINNSGIIDICISNIQQMMDSRGYNLCIGSRDYKYKPDDDFRLQLTFKKENSYVEVFMIKNVKLDKAFYDGVCTVASRLSDRNHFIYIIDSPLSKINEIPKDSSSGYTLELFTTSFFRYSLEEMPFSHTYEKASEKEVDELVKAYGSTQKFPIIYNSDRVVRWLGLDVGDILKIIRPSVTFSYFATEKGMELLRANDYCRVSEKL